MTAHLTTHQLHLNQPVNPGMLKFMSLSKPNYCTIHLILSLAFSGFTAGISAIALSNLPDTHTQLLCIAAMVSFAWFSLGVQNVIGSVMDGKGNQGSGSVNKKEPA